MEKITKKEIGKMEKNTKEELFKKLGGVALSDDELENVSGGERRDPSAYEVPANERIQKIFDV